MKPLLLDWAATVVSYFPARTDPHPDGFAGALVGLPAQGACSASTLPTTRATPIW
jgi:hypothetical protein